MKQLKIIIDNINPQTGYININFNQTIDINPFSSIALDKISMQVAPPATGTLQIQSNQTLTLITQNQGSKITASRSVVIPAGTYAYNLTGAYDPNASTSGLPDIVNTLNNLFNGSLNGAPNASNQTELDIGLGFKWIGFLDGATAPVFKLRLDIFQAPLSETGGNSNPIPILNGTQVTPVNMPVATSFVSTGFGLTSPPLTEETGGDYYGYVTKQIIQGCFQGVMRIIYGNITNNDFQFGLFKLTAPNTKPTILYGITAEEGKIYILNNGVKSAEIDIANFSDYTQPTCLVYMFTDPSTGNLRLATKKSNVFYITPIDSYSGYDFTIPYFMGVTGFVSFVGNLSYFTDWRCLVQPNLSQDNLGTYYELPPTRIYQTDNNILLGATTPNRQVQISFAKAPLLITSMGFNLNIIQGNVNSTSTFSISAINGLDFVSYYDLGLDILNLSLETYVGNTNGVNCGKKNTVAYFVLNRISDTNPLFYSEMKQMVFLSIENKQPISISTMQFRIYDVNTNQPINLTTGSFNLYIADKSDDGGHSRMFPAGSRGLGGDVFNVAQF
jgi:hypothetical protein